jgi:hypothetical protein
VGSSMLWSVGTASAFPGLVLCPNNMRETVEVRLEKTDAALSRLTGSAALNLASQNDEIITRAVSELTEC